MPSERNDPGNEVGADDAPQQDSWFEPVRRAERSAASNGHAGDPGDLDAEWAGNGDGSDGHQAAEWFLRAGRAGLLPESMTESWDADGETTGQWRQEAAGSPPWESDVVVTDGAPPPWESGPWPEPGEERNGAAGPAGDVPATTGAPQVTVQGQPPWPSLVAAPEPAGPAENWQARAALITGFLPLLVPGIVLGVLGLRRSRVVGAGQAASWAGIALSVVWAVVLGVLVFGTGGSSSAGCSVPGAVSTSYAQVMKDFSGGAATSAQSADISAAARQANSAAAYAGQLPLRNALFTLARDLEQAQSDLAGRSHTVPTTLRRKLGADGPALTTACKS